MKTPLKDELGRFKKGNSGFWKGKSRKGLKMPKRFTEEEQKRKRADWMIEWRKNNNEKHLEYKKSSEVKARMTVLHHYGGKNPKCKCCGEKYIMMLAIDHVKGDGGKMRREKVHGSGYSLWRYLIRNNFPEGYQVLCHGCNMGKSFYGYCPHETKDPKLVLIGQKKDFRWDSLRGSRDIHSLAEK